MRLSRFESPNVPQAAVAASGSQWLEDLRLRLLGSASSPTALAVDALPDLLNQIELPSTWASFRLSLASSSDGLQPNSDGLQPSCYTNS